MPYDPALDKEVFKVTKELGESRITVGVFSYNNGEKKLQLSRENSSEENQWRFAKLGRMNKKEAQEVAPLIMKAIENM